MEIIDFGNILLDENPEELDEGIILPWPWPWPTPVPTPYCDTYF